MSPEPTPQEALLAAAGASYFTGAATSPGDAAAEPASALMAAEFAAHAQMYQTVCAQIAVVQELLATTLGLNVTPYPAAEQDGTPTATT